MELETVAKESQVKFLLTSYHKMSKEKPLGRFRATFNQIRIENPTLRKKVERLIAISYEKDEQKEITRRLKIQNKKLLEQLMALKKRLKKSNAEKAKIIEKLNYLKKINNSLSDTLGSCPHCGEKILPTLSARGGKI